MLINVLTELRQPIGSVTTYDLSEPAARLDGLEVRDVNGAARLLRTDRGLLVTVEATGVVTEQCVRCLKDAECRVEIVLEEEYVPVVDPNTGTRVRVREGDSFRIGPDYLLDLREGLRQYVLMSEPLKPLCRPDCAGLCPECGADLNAGPCRCARAGDERWGALASPNLHHEKGS
jgi:uncharacterized protein